jgi:phosphoribosyl-AMP cyclohydrolase
MVWLWQSGISSGISSNSILVYIDVDKDSASIVVV